MTTYVDFPHRCHHPRISDDENPKVQLQEHWLLSVGVLWYLIYEKGIRAFIHSRRVSVNAKGPALNRAADRLTDKLGWRL